MDCGVVDSVLSWNQLKMQKELKKQDGAKRQRLLGVPKLDDANDAGGRVSEQCTPILTEGDSAKALAISGLSVVGRDKYGVFPLRCGTPRPIAALVTAGPSRRVHDLTPASRAAGASC